MIRTRPRLDNRFGDSETGEIVFFLVKKQVRALLELLASKLTGIGCYDTQVICDSVSELLNTLQINVGRIHVFHSAPGGAEIQIEVDFGIACDGQLFSHGEKIWFRT